MNERDILAQKDFAVKEALLKGEAKGRTEGRAEGLAEGEAKGKRETAKILLKKGLDISFISEVTRLPKEEILCL